MPTINARHLKGRGHCASCTTPWGCFRPWCGCHGEPYELGACGCELYVPITDPRPGREYA